MRIPKLNNWHIKHNAIMTPLWNAMTPEKYTSWKSEHIHTKNKASVFDNSYMGKYEIKGKHSRDFINRIFTSDVEINNTKYGLLLNMKGCIMDDVRCYNVSKDQYIFRVNPINMDKINLHFKQQARYFSQIEITDMSDRLSLIRLQGPSSDEVFKSVYNTNPLKPSLCKLMNNSFVSKNNDDSYEIYAEDHIIESIWDEINKHSDVEPAGLLARTSLKLENVEPVYGLEMDENTTPLDSNLKWCMDMGGKYLGKERLDNYRPSNKLIGLICSSDIQPEHGLDLFDDNIKVGNITSGGYNPILNKNIAIGSIRNSSGIGPGVTLKYRKDNDYAFCKTLYGDRFVEK